MTCAEVEILLCDYLDGTLAEAERGTLEAHLAGCEACRTMYDDIRGAVALIGRAAEATPPPELLTRILHEMPGRDLARRTGLWRRLRSGWLAPVLNPRYAMGMAMTILSFSMIFKFAGIEPRQLKPADLDPVKIWASLDTRAHRTWDRATKYYENLRVVLEIQSRLSEWADQSDAAARAPARKPDAAPKGRDGR